MATTTPNFGWPVPTSTDLVKDGATAIEALGDGIDASLVDLRGGTTGQILAKATNTDMDFAWITNDVGDITAVTAGTGITGGGTSGDVTVSFDQANFGGGQFAAGKNKVINGNFGIWQRGINLTVSDQNQFLADRWKVNYGVALPTSWTISQQAFTAGTAPVAGYEGTFFMRSAITTIGSAVSCRLVQPIEDVRTFAGQTVTLSFWAKADSSRTIVAYLTQNFGSGGSASVNTSLESVAVTTGWVRYTRTWTLASIAGKTIGTSNSLEVRLQNPDTASTIDYWGVQLEAGSQMTPFQTASGGSPQAELAMCQRYYWRFTPAAAGDRFGNGLCDSTTVAQLLVQFPVSMRTAPSALEQSGTATDYQVRTAAATSTNCSSVPTFSATSTNSALVSFTVASGLVAGQAMNGRAVNTAAYLGWSAEL